MVEAVSTAIRTILVDSVDWLDAQIKAMTGVQLEQNFLLLIVIGFGCSMIVLILASMVLLLRGIGGSGGAKKPAKAKPAKPPKQPKPQKPARASGGIGVMLKSLVAKLTPKRKSNLGPNPAEVMARRRAKQADISDQNITLSSIESEMLALKELYSSGHISAEVYITETRILYDKAQALS